MSSFWSNWVIILTVVSLVALVWILFSNRKAKLNEDNEAKTGHVYDGIEEYDNPLPAWWFNWFMLTIIFSVGYLILYPGLGNFKGVLNWTSVGQWQADVDRAEKRYGPMYEAYAKTPIPELSKDAQAMKIGRRLFSVNCATCHGSDARGFTGYPNLSDNDWLYGNSPEQIVASITNGRKAVMPAWGAALGEEGVKHVAAYIQQMGRESTQSENSDGAQKYAMMCVACHGADGKGNALFGAPNLTDDIWLYGSSTEAITHSIAQGRSGEMPAHKEILSKEKIHLLAAYIYGLSSKESSEASN